MAPCVFLTIAAVAAIIVLVDNLREISRDTVEELMSNVSEDAVFVS